MSAQDPWDHPDPQVSQDTRELQDPRDRLDTPGRMAMTEFPDLRESLGSLERRDLKDHKEFPDLRDHPELLDHVVSKGVIF